ncbi:phosphoribosylanthranilate isomerase [Actinokineospora auranticolor]|uniref:N-(5'-phosphoribosyl)anthranilate isomerase n=1 Tax=Actinokineospora auranticolor TaxID=155976 RepID=A0A2S6GCQ8_9PSEU|nr:phosphoribosylanthranilate isomerase [Actinokineospora auranticolor]PPK62381.1 phosphoribosylanthranilate isomerase [Actinokineospora auranticolor]
MFTKVCGLRTPSDVAVAVAAGADAVGFVFAESARKVTVDQARALAAEVPPTVLTVGVFAGIPAETAASMTQDAGLAAIQLHGDYPRESFAALADLPVKLIRATALGPETELATGAWGEDLLLLDSPVAGSGERWNLSTLDNRRPTGDWLLAGGLTPDNVATAIAAAHPWGVDVSSGVESSRGVKDPDLIRAFLSAARAAP